jgi:predicted amidohydrolase
MMREVNLAAVRMDAAPASVDSRLERAESLVARVAAQGAHIAVLPELFNTGYEYTPNNYALAERMDGRTVSWLKTAARKHNIYIAGTFLLRESDGIYNTMLLVAPDGNIWRYDKSYPWAWERAYFGPRRSPIQVADTEFGKIGMLICWDVAHTKLWAQYAGKIDLMLASSCPPLVHQIEFHFVDGRTVKSSELGAVMQGAYANADKTFGELFRNQARWLGVPSVHATGAGKFRSVLPRPKISLAALFSARPDLWKYIAQAGKVQVSAGYFNDTFIANAQGDILNKTSGDEYLAVATVQLSDQRPVPSEEQPEFGLPRQAYLADQYSNSLLEKYYNKHWRQA